MIVDVTTSQTYDEFIKELREIQRGLSFVSEADLKTK